MIGVSYCGRLGNQLFQFHFFQYLKQTHKDKRFFIPNPRHSVIYKYFNLKKYHYMGSKAYAAYGLMLYKTGKFSEVYMQNTARPKPPQPEESTIYHGFHQTDWYLNRTPKPIGVRVKKKYQSQFDKLYGDIFKGKIIVVHIRRTDYLNYGKRDISVPIGFFKDRLAEIPDTDKYQVIFCTDDLPFVKEHFPPQPNYIFSENKEIIDFQIIMNADIAIISNSSFSWWAAYLSPKKNLVIAPKNWMGHRIGKEHPKGVMTSKFEWHEVTDAHQ